MKTVQLTIDERLSLMLLFRLHAKQLDFITFRDVMKLSDQLEVTDKVEQERVEWRRLPNGGAAWEDKKYTAIIEIEDHLLPLIKQFVILRSKEKNFSAADGPGLLGVIEKLDIEIERKELESKPHSPESDKGTKKNG